MSFLSFPIIAFGQNNDAIKITEAKLAIDKYNDYNAALKALDEVSTQGKSDPLYIYYSAIANEKIGEYEKAVSFYNQYLKIFPDKIEIIEKIADLNYKIKLNKDLSGTWQSLDDQDVNYTIYQTRDSIFMQYKTVSLKNNLFQTGWLKFKGIRNNNTLTGEFFLGVLDQSNGNCKGSYDYAWVSCNV